jgi:RNA polymerase sigma-70 factor, ECF subfamily
MQTGTLETFTTLRPFLHSLAYQMLGNRADADDMLQECFLRWEKANAELVRSPKAYLTTVMTRLCLKHLQSARVQQEYSVGSAVPENLLGDQVLDPADHARLADSLSVALFVVLRTLSPIERVVFLLREVFECDYGEIGGVIDKSEENCRQILRRARDHIANRQPRYEIVPQHEERTLQKFLQASANGDWEGLIDVLTDETTLVCDGGDLRAQPPEPVCGVRAVTDFVSNRIAAWMPRGGQTHRIFFHGCPGVLASEDGIPTSAIFASVANDRIKGLSIVTCPVRLRTLMIQVSRQGHED